MKNPSLAVMSFFLAVACAGETPKAINDDQIELVLIASAANGTLKSRSPMANVLAMYPETVRLTSSSIPEWRYGDLGTWRREYAGSALGPDDGKDLAKWLESPWVTKYLPKYKLSFLTAAHATRAIEASLEKDIDAQTKFLALASAGGRMAALSDEKQVAMNSLIKNTAHGGEAAAALAKMEQTKIARIINAFTAAGSDTKAAEFSRKLWAGIELDGESSAVRLVTATAYVGGNKPQVFWRDFQPDWESRALQFNRDVVSWTMNERNLPEPSDITAARVHVCAFDNFETIIVLGSLSEDQKKILLRDNLERILTKFSHSGLVVLLTRPGSPIIGVAAEVQ